jgi:cobalt-zinc-cadmium efflux system outer membrane protein
MLGRLDRQLRVVVATLVLLGLSGSSASVAEARKGVVTGESLVNDILAHNPELLVYEANIRAARGERTTAEQWANPELSTRLGNKHDSGKDGPAWAIDLKQTFEWPGRFELRRLVAEKEVALAELALAKFRAALAAESRAAAYDLSFASQQAGAIKEVQARYRALVSVLSRRETPGVNPLLERRVIEATAFGLNGKVINVDVEAATARARLEELRGAPLPADLRIQASTFSLDALPSTSTLVAAAHENNVDLLIGRSEVEHRRLKIDLARNERHPAFSIGPYLSNERAVNHETQIGVAFTVPLPLWSRNEGRIAAEEARGNGAEAALVVTEREVDRLITESADAYRLSVAGLKSTRWVSIEELKRAAASADEHYRLGAVPVSTYIELQKQYLDAVETTIELQRRALQARHRLERITGLDLGPSAAVSVKR